MFFEALQSYCAPVLTLTIFIAIIKKDTLFDKRIRILFLCESFVILLIIAATWADRCLSAAELGGMAWKLRTATTYINFSMSPISPLFLMMIYNNKSVVQQAPYFIPILINLILCTASLYTGWIFYITPENVYSRGILFFVPFLVSGFYLLTMIFLSAKPDQKKINRREETSVLIVIMMVITIASLLEIIFVKRFMLWSTTEVCVILYFMVLSRQKIKYDDLTGTYSRIAYSKRIERLPDERSYIIGMLDIDGLKTINDTLGHIQGDKAISRIANGILKETGRNMQLYRIGGDEFALIAVKNTEQSVIDALERAEAGLGKQGDLTLTFSYGVAVMSGTDAFESVRSLADERLYMQKATRKKEAM